MWTAVKPTTGVRQIGWLASVLMLIALLEIIKVTCYP